MKKNIVRKPHFVQLMIGMILTTVLIGCSLLDIQGPKILETTKVLEVTKVIYVTKVMEVTRIVTVIPTKVTPAIKSISEGVYFTQGENLYRMNLDGSGVDQLTTGIVQSERMAIDEVHKKLYISRWGAADQILVVDLNAPDLPTVFASGPAAGGQGLALDPRRSELYLGEYYDGVFGTKSGSAGTWTQLVSVSDLSPMLGQRGQMQMDVVNRQLYFRSAYNGDCGECRYIWRVNLDGTKLVQIIPANGGDGLALDMTKGKIYFSDVPGDGTIRRASLNGTGSRVILTIPAPYTFCRSIAVDTVGKMLYYSLLDQSNDPVGRAIAHSNTDGAGFEILYEAMGTGEEMVGDIAIVHGE
jgi:hypothetical protein